MQLKKIYNTEGQEPILDHIKVLRYGKKQNFTQKFINRGVAEGFLSMEKGRIVLHTDPELHYRIVRTPGMYCVFDDHPLDDEKAAMAYLA